MQELQGKREEQIDEMGEECRPETFEPCHAGEKPAEAEMDLSKQAILAYEHDLPEVELVRTWLMPLLRKAGWNTEAITGKYIVRSEKIGPQGRVDVALSVGQRIVACIEVKRPRIDINDHLEQALKYSSGYYYPQNGILDPILTVATNGMKAVLMDCALTHPQLSANRLDIDLTKETGVKQLVEFLNRDSMDNEDGSIPWIKTKRAHLKEPFASNRTKDLLNTVEKMTDSLISKGYSKYRSVELSIICLLLAAARDNAIIPNQAIQRCSELGKWSELRKHLEDVFGNVFSGIKSEEVHDFWEIYQPTQGLPIRLDIIPVDYIGLLYEKILIKYTKNKTSFYTPKSLIDIVIEYVKPSVTNSILDPTCGSGAMLASAVVYAVNKEIEREGQISDRLLKQFIDKVVGVDKDSMACRIAKVTLIATFMRIVGEQYRHTGRALPRPQIVDEPTDFFDYEGLPVDIVIGNPPWESLEKLEISRKEEFRASYESFSGHNDQLCYVVEKSIKNHLRAHGRFGFVVKQQSLNAASYFEFMKFMNQKVEKIVDFGDETLFNNYAQTAILLGSPGYSGFKWTINRMHPQKIATINGKTNSFVDFYHATMGAKSSYGFAYKAFAKQYPKHDCVKQHPTCLELGIATKIEKIAYFVDDDVVPQEFEAWLKVNKSVMNKLKSRRDVTDRKGKNPYSWTRDNTRKSKGPVLITERTLKPKRDRFPFIIDKTREYVATGGQTCIASRTGNLQQVTVFASLLVSDFFIPLCRNYRMASRREGGIFLSPTELSKLQIPDISKADLNILCNIVENSKHLSMTEVKKINSVFSRYLSVGSEDFEERHLYSKMSLTDYYFSNHQESERKSA